MIWGVAPDPIRFFEKKAKQKTIRLVQCEHCAYNRRAKMCAKNFPLEVFWRYLFSKKGSK